MSVSQRLTVSSFALSILALAVLASPALAQQPAPPQSEDDQKLEALLSEADLFYKKSYFEGGQRWEYKIAWSEDGETSMLVLYLRSIGTRSDGSKIWVVYAWTQAMGLSQGEQLSPTVIKTVAALNDNLTTGNYSATANGAFANTGMVFEGLSAKALRLMLWDLHYNRVFLKKKLAEQS